jgi:hypothetical protein
VSAVKKDEKKEVKTEIYYDSLSENDLEKIKGIFVDVVEEKIKKTVDDMLKIEREITSAEMLGILKRYCPIKEDERVLAPDGLSILRSLGDGDLVAGLQEFRKNQTWTKATRQKSEQISTVIIISAIGVIVAGFLGSLWLGIKFLLTVSGD